MKFRQADRLAEDWQTLRIHELDGFSLFLECEKHSFKNMVYSYPLRDDQKQFIQNDLERASKLSIRDGFNLHFERSTLSLVKSFMMVAHQVPKVYRDIIRDLDYAHKLAFPKRDDFEIDLRYNSDYPQIDDSPNHMHRPVFVLTVEGESTIIKNEEGGYFKPETAELILLGNYVEHYAPASSEPSKPRATFIID